MFWHTIGVEIYISLSTLSLYMNFKFLISEDMFWHVVKIRICIFSATPISGTNKPFSRLSVRLRLNVFLLFQ